MLTAAGKEPVDEFGRTVRDHVNERTAAEDLEERRRRQRARREANIKQESDGMYKLFGTFDPVAGARIETALANMAKQIRLDEDPKGRATPAQRYADALEALITRQGAGTGGKPQRTTLLVIQPPTPTQPTPRSAARQQQGPPRRSPQRQTRLPETSKSPGSNPAEPSTNPSNAETGSQ